MVRRTRELPEAFVERIGRIFPGSRGKAVLHTFTRAKPTTLRVNALAGEARAVREELEAAGLRVAPVGWYADAFELTRGRDRDLRASAAYAEGRICVQGLASMLPPLVLAPRPGESVVDLAAAPGSKTTQLASLMRGEGHIVACDPAPLRFEKLAKLVQEQGAGAMVELLRASGEELPRRLGRTFDRVLLDAPCSGEARLGPAAPGALARWGPAELERKARLQRRLLRAALALLRPGGELVYSTCTFAPEENEAVIDTALREAPDELELLPIDVPLPAHQPGRLEWDGRRFHASLARTVRVVPTTSLEGFFLARLRRRGGP